MHGQDLRRLFGEYNESYFGGRLPDYRLRSVARITRLGEDGDCNRHRRIIRVLRSLGDNDSRSCLLHEMAHAATTGGHGKLWKAEMIRLREAGAPLCVPDAAVRMDDWDGKSVSQEMFRRVSKDLLIGSPNATCSVAIWHFISTVGGGVTTAGFQRKYPWVTRVFRKCQKEHREELKRVEAFRARFAGINAKQGDSK